MSRYVCEHFVPVDLPCSKCEKPPTLRAAAEAVIEQLKGGFVAESDPVAQDLKAALAEEALQRLTDVQQEMERHFCPRCGKRTNDIHTCTPPGEQQ